MNWQHERSMTPRQYAHTLELLGLSQLAAGRYLGVSGRTSRRYCTGDAAIPPAHALLLRALLHHRERPVVPAWHRRQS